MTASCEKSEKEAIEERSEKAVQKKDTRPSKQSSGEKSEGGMDLSQMYIPGFKECVDVPYDCTSPIIVTPGLEPQQDRLDRAIATGTVQELEAWLFEELFPELPNDEINGILSGDIGLCRTQNEEERRTFYIGYDKRADIECEEARNEKEARMWVLQTQYKGRG